MPVLSSSESSAEGCCTGQGQTTTLCGFSETLKKLDIQRCLAQNRGVSRPRLSSSESNALGACVSR